MLPSNRSLPKGLAIASQSAEFWRRLAPDLTISDAQPKSNKVDIPSDIAMRLVNDGFVKLKNPGLSAPVAKIAKAMDRIVAAGLPAAFIGVYDEVWAMIADMDGALGDVFDGNAAMVPDFWAAHGVADAGFAAGRKRPGQGVFKDGRARNVTVWMPLTDATPDNGCVYVVPAGQDRNYGTPERADASLPGIRALPAKAGDVLLWTGETYHWQSRPDRHNEDGPLMSLTWEFQSVNDAPIDGLFIESYPYVPFETRLGLLARQMPRHRGAFSGQPIWRAVQQTLSNRFPLTAKPSQS